jgi:hypothetical protein
VPATQVPFEVIQSKQHFSLALHFQLTFLLSIPEAEHDLLFSFAASASMATIGKAIMRPAPSRTAINQRMLHLHRYVALQRGQFCISGLVCAIGSMRVLAPVTGCGMGRFTRSRAADSSLPRSPKKFWFAAIRHEYRDEHDWGTVLRKTFSNHGFRPLGGGSARLAFDGEQRPNIWCPRKDEER